jgi:hypothetical protein
MSAGERGGLSAVGNVWKFDRSAGRWWIKERGGRDRERPVSNNEQLPRSGDNILLVVYFATLFKKLRP